MNFKRPLEKGRLLLLSPFPDRRRAAKDLAKGRNRFAAALAQQLYIIHAESGGGLEKICTEAVTWGKPVAALNHSANAHLFRGLAARLDLKTIA